MFFLTSRSLARLSYHSYPGDCFWTPDLESLFLGGSASLIGYVYDLTSIYRRLALYYN